MIIGFPMMIAGTIRVAEIQNIADPRSNHGYPHRIISPLGNDQMSMSLGRLDKFQVHGSNRLLILFNDRVEGAMALIDIALHTADQSDIGIRVDINHDVEQLPELGLVEHEDALDDDHQSGLDPQGLVGPRMAGKIVDGDIDRLAIPQFADVSDDIFVVEGVGMVEVDGTTLFVGEMRQVLVVRIVMNIGDVRRPYFIDDGVGDGCLARTRPSCYPDDHHLDLSAFFDFR